MSFKDYVLCLVTYTTIVVLLSAPLASMVSRAEDMPKEFDFKSTGTWAETYAEAISLGEKDRAAIWQHKNVTINDAGDFFMHNMVAHCIGYRSPGSESTLTGTCSYEDKDGNQLYETYESKTRGQGTSEVFGGTGPYAGIRCTSDWQASGFAQEAEGGVYLKTGHCIRDSKIAVQSFTPKTVPKDKRAYWIPGI